MVNAPCCPIQISFAGPVLATRSKCISRSPPDSGTVHNNLTILGSDCELHKHIPLIPK